MRPERSYGRRIRILSLARTGTLLVERLMGSRIPALEMQVDVSHRLLELHVRYLLRLGNHWQHDGSLTQYLLDIAPVRDLISDIGDEVHDMLLDDLKPHGVFDSDDDEDEVLKDVCVQPNHDALLYWEDDAYLSHLDHTAERIRLDAYDPDRQYLYR